MCTVPSFEELGLAATLLDSIRERGLTAPTEVQALVADDRNATRDLLVSSRTGSGKTLAFGVLIAREILDGTGRARRDTRPRALVVAPTRELAVQVRRELEWLFEKTGARVASVTGGSDTREELRALKHGCEILVATPGRLVDHLTRKSTSLDSVEVAVLDEGDEMLRFGFKEDLEKILSSATKRKRTHLFSATLPPPILKLASTYQKDATRVSAGGGKAEAHADIEYVAHLHGPGERTAAVVNVLRRWGAPSAIVFTETRAGASQLGAELGKRGFAAVVLSGELTQAERTRALGALREGRARVLVATDVAARGLDLPDVGLVVHADPPQDSSGVTHRSGRTGRAGKKGVSVLLSPRNRRKMAERLLSSAGVKARWSPLPTKGEILASDRDRLASELAEEALRPLGDGESAFVDTLLDRIPVRELVATLLARTTGSLPAPMDIRAVEEERPRPEAKRGEPRPREERPRDKHKKSARRGGGVVHFRVNVGDRHNASPRWLVPMICRRGKIEARDLGAITIFARSTVFEIAAEGADHFERNVMRPDPKEPHVRFARVDEDERPDPIQRTPQGYDEG